MEFSGQVASCVPRAHARHVLEKGHTPKKPTPPLLVISMSLYTILRGIFGNESPLPRGMPHCTCIMSLAGSAEAQYPIAVQYTASTALRWICSKRALVQREWKSRKVQLSPNEYIREKSHRVHWSTTGLQNISLTKLHLSVCILCSRAELHENHLSPIVGRGPQSNEPVTNWKIGI